jgi:hypothetical protein
MITGSTSAETRAAKMITTHARRLVVSPAITVGTSAIKGHDMIAILDEMKTQRSHFDKTD